MRRKCSESGLAFDAREADVVAVGRNSAKHSLTGTGTGGAIGPVGHVPVSAFVLLSRICWRSGNTRVGLVVRWFSPGELYSSVSDSLICPDFGNIANSGPFVFVLLRSAVPAAPPRSFCSQL